MNFKKNEKTYDAEKSAVFKVLQEEQNDPEPGTYYKHPMLFFNKLKDMLYVYLYLYKISVT